MPTDREATCCACGARMLHPHLRVRRAGADESLHPTTEAFGAALADLLRCAACGHGQLAELPREAVLDAAYAQAESMDYVDEEEGQRETARRALTRIEAVRPPGRLLDLGCWVGFLLDEARRRGWQTVGVEPSRFASAYARDRLGLDVLTAGLFDAPLQARSFDAVVLGDVIEHLPAPGDALRRVRALLRPGGVVWLALPDAGSLVARGLGARWWSVLPTHVQYFTRRSMLALLRQHAFAPVWLGTAPKAFTVGYYLGRAGGYSPALGRTLVRGAEVVGLAGRPWAPDFGDRMAVLART